MIIVPVEKQIDWRRPPLVLIALVVINILVYAFYQTGDTQKITRAVEYYQQHEMLDIEWRAYKAYARDAELPWEVSKQNQYMSYYMVSDVNFDRFMSGKGEQFVPRAKRQSWRSKRDQLEAISSTISGSAFGFHSNQISLMQLISSQFLHGDIQHLLGNMVFLVLVGFAVEAALGSGVFLAYYLVSGIGAALLYAAMAPAGGGSLIGASGSISGVMAMYVVLFGFRKIQFFYWVVVVTGYFRAAAIFMLPVYLLKEVHSYMTLEGSNIAFTAHIGGFITGAALVWLTRELRSEVIDDDYLDNKPEAVDRTALAIQRIYDQVGQCEFAKAWEMLKPIKQNHPNRMDVIELEFNLVRAHHPKKVKEYLIHRMDKPANSVNLVTAQLHHWRSLNTQEVAGIPIAKHKGVLDGALDVGNIQIAEEVFRHMKTVDGDPMTLAVAARQLSTFCRESNSQDKADKYGALAQELASSNFKGGQEVNA